MTDPTVDALALAVTVAAWGYDFSPPIDAGRVGRDLAPKAAAALADAGYIVVRGEDTLAFDPQMLTDALNSVLRKQPSLAYAGYVYGETGAAIAAEYADLRAALAIKETPSACDIVEDPFGMDKSDQENTYYCKTHDQYIGPADEGCRAALTTKETP